MTSSETHEKFMRAALVEAKRSTNEGNQGVGSVVVRDGQIVARGRNLENTTHDPTTHAETVAIQNYSKTYGSGDLSGTVMYTTFEPCPMCCGAILTSGAPTVVMGGRPDPAKTRWGDYSRLWQRPLDGSNHGICKVRQAKKDPRFCRPQQTEPTGSLSWNHFAIA